VFVSATESVKCFVYGMGIVISTGCSGRSSAPFWLMDGITVLSWQLVGEHGTVVKRTCVTYMWH